WDASYVSSSGAKVDLLTVFPVSGTKGTGPEGITAEAIWVGVGAEPDFLGRDVKGKAVIIYSTFVPGGRSHSASDRAGLFDANTRAEKLGAAMVINVMAVPGNGHFQPEGGLRKIPQMTVSQDEGFALRDRLGNGEKISLTLRLDIPPLTNVQTAYVIATLPGRSDEQIMLNVHTDGYFQAATDNNSGMAAALELARHYAALPIEKRPRTLAFVLFPDHHHGEVAHRMKGGIDQIYDWSKVALKLTIEHPSETSLYMYNSGLTATNNLSAVRFNALGSPEFENMALEQLREFGVSVYGVEDGPKNGSFAPSFHIINHVVYHTSLDTPELVPAEGMQRSVRAFASIIDHVNRMTLAEVRGPNFPPKDGRGTVMGPMGMGASIAATGPASAPTE
ncbi:MAG TPA: M28 family peptidase, partial [Burkholderiales bacterium]|nr:M28 family peptidase [Burkholderiales bacterium]